MKRINWIGDEDSVLYPLICGLHSHASEMMKVIYTNVRPDEYCGLDYVWKLSKAVSARELVKGATATLLRAKQLGEGG